MIGLKDKNIVLIGGGSGNAALLRGLKYYTDNITVLVNVVDDGGSSGRIRRNIDMIPPGDIRNCLVALADDDNEMKAIVAKRFDDGTISNESLGNLLFVALYEITKDYLTTIDTIRNILSVKAGVLPITTECIQLAAVLRNGDEVVGESRIASESVLRQSPVERIKLIPEDTSLLEECRTAIRQAHVIIYSPGSLYTSLMPDLLVGDIVEELEKSSAMRIYMVNAMSEQGETDGYTVSDMVRAVEKHTDKRKIIDTVIYNTAPIPEDILLRYADECAAPIAAEIDGELASRYDFIGDDIISTAGGTVRHDAGKLWKILERI
ncbi:MAG: YvcK family protein [Eubacteriaceae bacterium]|nr:YvcK family protein [Eubacteriaceae bacterium]